MVHTPDNPFGSHSFGEGPFGPVPAEGQAALINITATAVGDGVTELVGEAAIDFLAEGVFTPLEFPEGAASITFTATGVGVGIAARVKVITTFPRVNRGVTAQPYLKTISSSQRSGRGITGLSHTGLN